MWPFRKKENRRREAFAGFTDWHCHILPGVDDGVQTTDEALEILRLYEELGVAEVWLTPHIMEDIPNTPSQLRERFDALRAAYGGSVRLHLGAENMIDNLFEERLEADELLPVGDEGDLLLVETSYFNPPMRLDRILQRIREKGYTPVLAHPERYLYMEMKEYRALRTAGVKFQQNLFSSGGFYGRHARSKARSLQRRGMYDFAGTDLHSLRMLEQYISQNEK